MTDNYDNYDSRDKIRIQKWLSNQGTLSRRQTEAYLQKGWILVNGQPITEPGTKIDPQIDVVTFSPELDAALSQRRYLMFYKPKGVVTNCPKSNEKQITDCLPAMYKDLHAVGRLDKDSEGLILLTDDGIFAKKMLESETARVYHVWIDQNLTPGMKDKLTSGKLTLFGEKLKKVHINQLTARQFIITLHEGKNRQIRRMLRKVGAEVVRLKRLKHGKYDIGGLKEGEFRAVEGL